MKNKLKYFIRILKLFFWPIILNVTQFLIITIFTLFFNFNYKNSLKQEYQNLKDNEINIEFEKITNTDKYIHELNDFLEDNGTLIIIITTLVLLPFIIKVYNKLKNKNTKKIETKTYFNIIFISILLSISLNIILYLINRVVSITNRYDNIQILLYTIIPTGMSIAKASNITEE